MEKRQRQNVILEGCALTPADRDVIGLWCGQKLASHGNLTLRLTKQQALALGDLLTMLGKFRTGETAP